MGKPRKGGICLSRLEVRLCPGQHRRQAACARIDLFAATLPGEERRGGGQQRLCSRTKGGLACRCRLDDPFLSRRASTAKVIADSGQSILRLCACRQSRRDGANLVVGAADGPLQIGDAVGLSVRFNSRFEGLALEAARCLGEGGGCLRELLRDSVVVDAEGRRHRDKEEQDPEPCEESTSEAPLFARYERDQVVLRCIRHPPTPLLCDERLRHLHPQFPLLLVGALQVAKEAGK